MSPPYPAGVVADSVVLYGPVTTTTRGTEDTGRNPWLSGPEQPHND